MANDVKWSEDQQELELFLAGIKPAICLDEGDERVSLSEMADYPVERFREYSYVYFQDEGLREWYVDMMAEFDREDADVRYVLGIVLGYYPGAVTYFTDPENMNPWTLVTRGFVNYYGMRFGFERSMEGEVLDWLEATYEIPESLKDRGELTVVYPHENLFG